MPGRGSGCVCVRSVVLAVRDAAAPVCCAARCFVTRVVPTLRPGSLISLLETRHARQPRRRAQGLWQRCVASLPTLRQARFVAPLWRAFRYVSYHGSVPQIATAAVRAATRAVSTSASVAASPDMIDAVRLLSERVAAASEAGCAAERDMLLAMDITDGSDTEPDGRDAVVVQAGKAAARQARAAAVQAVEPWPSTPCPCSCTWGAVAAWPWPSLTSG